MKIEDVKVGNWYAVPLGFAPRQEFVRARVEYVTTFHVFLVLDRDDSKQGGGIKLVESMFPVPGYEAIRAKADELDLPKLYRRDLTEHDWNALVKQPTAPFGWGIHDTGTFLVTPEHTDPRYIDTIVQAWGWGEQYHSYWWDGSTLEEVAPQVIIDRFLKNAKKQGK
jgi:hypothetical protein